MRSSITIVGLSKEYNKDEVLQILPMQNDFIRKFTVSNNIEDHITIYAIRPLKNNPSRFQVFASVSPVFHQGLRHHQNKVTLGLISCRVYDRYHVKRCNYCQGFGHYARDCPNSNSPTCGNCSGEHQTSNCSSTIRKCTNCSRSNINNSDHAATSSECPSFTKQVNQLKHKLSRDHLNLPSNNYIPNK